MLDMIFGVMLATSGLNDPMDTTALDERASTHAPVEVVRTIEPGAGDTSPVGQHLSRVLITESRK